MLDKKIFSERLSALRKKRGYNTQNALATAYNQKFPVKRRDEAGGNEGDSSGVFGTIKHYENREYESSPKLSIVLNLCELLDCDIDYLIGKIDTPHRETQDAAKQTGLTYDAVCFLEEIKLGNNTKNSEVLKAINMLLSEDRFDECYKYWDRLATFLFSPKETFRALMWNGEREFMADDVLAILLSENEQVLRKFRRGDK